MLTQPAIENFVGDNTVRGWIDNGMSIVNIVGAAAATTIYERAGDKQQLFLQTLELQNVGNGGAIYVMINDTATDKLFMRVLNADTAALAGNGGKLSIPMGWDVKKVTVYAPTTTDLCVIKVLTAVNSRA